LQVAMNQDEPKEDPEDDEGQAHPPAEDPWGERRHEARLRRRELGVAEADAAARDVALVEDHEREEHDDAREDDRDELDDLDGARGAAEDVADLEVLEELARHRRGDADDGGDAEDRRDAAGAAT